MPMRATRNARKMYVVEASDHQGVVIVADGELARKGFEHYACAAGMHVEPLGAPVGVVLRGPDTGAGIAAPLHVIVDARGIRVEPHGGADPATVAGVVRLIGVLLSGWDLNDA